MAGDAYTGLKRRKQTPWTVKFGDAIVSRIIAIGGIGTIAAILMVILVLLGTALPLFRSPQFEQWKLIPPAKSSNGEFAGDANYAHFGLDDNGLLLWGMFASGETQVRSVHDGRLLASFPLTIDSGISITCSALSIDRSQLSVGLSDGTFRVADISFTTTLISPRTMPDGLTVSEENSIQALGRAVYQWFDANGVRRTEINDIVWSEPKKLGDGPVHALDFLRGDTISQLDATADSFALAVVGKDLVFAQIETKRHRITKKITESVEISSCELQNRSSDPRPLQLSLINGTDQAMVVWQHGTLDRYSLTGGEPKLVESQSAAIHCSITCAAPLLGRQTLLCGLDDGRLQGWMVTRSQSDDEQVEYPDPDLDGYRLALAHEVQVGESPLISVASSYASHVAVTCDAKNNIALVYVPADNLLKYARYPLDDALRDVAFGPRAESLIAVTDKSQAIAGLNMGHPEASLRGYFGKVWYEGHDYPKYIWQSSSATEQSEIKLSLIPLVFGTLKATVYAMLISVPLALLTAIYTSEFLSPSTRGRVKPVIEMMASLPSVVLGYIAALIVAPYLQEHLMSVLLALIVFPLTFVYAGNLWNLLPVVKLVQFQAFRLGGLLACLPIAAIVTITLAPLCESLLFNGDLIGWLGGSNGSAIGGWFFLLVPTFMVGASLLMFGPLTQWNRAVASRRSPRSYAIFALARLSIIVLSAAGLALGFAALLSGLGLDLRGHLVDSYQDRNALLVGFALGFCVIPIIYTICDDALQSVPQHLRSASLGCGATPWQTTMRVVVPSAMSGLFSAIMIGLGRAVGETMVVLCAAGNTPLMEWNPFNGFKTLSAALATELPEAAKGSTHFRTLFLAAVLLFFMTLIVNTLAEFVRIRFRKRSSQL